MVFSTFYFSGTGNTKWVVEQFCNIVINSGHKAEMFSIDRNEKLTDVDIKDIICNSDFIGIANPIYGADIPPIMKRFITRLIDIHMNERIVSKQIYIINTFGYVNPFGPFAAKRLFKNTNFNLTAYVNIRLCNNISTPKLKLDRVSEVKLHNRKNQAQKELILLCKRLISGQRYLTGISPYLIPGIIIRQKSRKAIRDNYQSLSVNTETCSRCMLCVNNCPTQSIRIKDDHFCFMPGCTACMRCYNFCPTSSIVFDLVYADPNIYHRYTGLE